MLRKVLTGEIAIRAQYHLGGMEILILRWIIYLPIDQNSSAFIDDNLSYSIYPFPIRIIIRITTAITTTTTITSSIIIISTITIGITIVVVLIPC